MLRSNVSRPRSGYLGVVARSIPGSFTWHCTSHLTSATRWISCGRRYGVVWNTTYVDSSVAPTVECHHARQVNASKIG